jgi:hypothetical protein
MARENGQVIPKMPEKVRSMRSNGQMASQAPSVGLAFSVNRR